MPEKFVTSSGRFLEVHPVGTQIALVKNPDCKGYVISLQFTREKRISPHPYKVYWYDPETVKEILESEFINFPDPKDLLYYPRILITLKMSRDCPTSITMLNVFRRMRALEIPQDYYLYSSEYTLFFSCPPGQEQGLQSLIEEFGEKESKIRW